MYINIAYIISIYSVSVPYDLPVISFAIHIYIISGTLSRSIPDRPGVDLIRWSRCVLGCSTASSTRPMPTNHSSNLPPSPSHPHSPHPPNHSPTLPITLPLSQSLSHPSNHSPTLPITLPPSQLTLYMPHR